MKKGIIGSLMFIIAATASHAIIIDNPLSLQTPFLVGVLNGDAGNSNLNTEIAVAQTILDLAVGQTSGNYQSNTIFNFGGTITSNGGQNEEAGGGFGDANDTVSIEAGWRWVLAKYDGQNGGYVLFALGNQASTIPEFPWNLWTINPEQYQISHYTLLDGPVPPPGDDPPSDDPPSVPEGGVGLGLFGLLLAGMGLVRKLKA